ncbi:hypothetical protein [Nocardia fluminea]|uniref:hypothetical protein n=1 Tax=Nocardia fluminea TaxID=134984 RepID=UPI0034023103
MGELRDLVQAGRLDRRPLSQIEHNLEQAGLGSAELTTSQWNWTLVYRTSSPIGRVIAAARGGSEHSDVDLFEAVAAAAATDTTTDQADELESLRATIGQIKALVTAV